MFRLALLSFLFAAASAKDINAISREFQRQMQGLNLDAFQFNFAGVNINADVAQAECPDEWTPVVSCVISSCPEFLDVCPDLNLPEENTGTIGTLLDMYEIVRFSGRQFCFPLGDRPMTLNY